MKRLFVSILIILTIFFCLISCSSNEDEGSDTADSSSVPASDTTVEISEDSEDGTTETDAPLLSIEDTKLSDYKIVIPNKSPTSVLNVAKKFSTGIKDKTGRSIVYMSDILIGQTGPVILLGDTRYEESAQTKKLLKDDYSFAIKVFDGGRIAICATESGVLLEAVEYFIEHYLPSEDGSFLLNDDTGHYQTIDFENIENSTVIALNGYTRYGIVYPEDSDARTKKLVNRFAVQMKKKTGATFEVYSENDDDAVQFEIAIGDTDRSSADTIPASDLEWKIFAEEKKIIINGSNYSITADALNEFLTDMVCVEGDFSYVDKTLSATEEKDDYFRSGWDIAAPAYDGGTLSANAYNNGSGRYSSASSDESTMQLVSATNATEFGLYADKLEANGYELISETVIDNNIHVQYEKGYSLIYAYYTDYYKEARIIDDCASVSEDEFEYFYEVKDGETIEVIQYGIMSTCDQAWPTNGMFYIIKLADNSVVLIDGGNVDQATNAAVDGAYQYLRDLTGVPEEEKIRVAALYYTHPHGDHVNMSPKLVSRYGDKLEIERVMCNFPSDSIPTGDDGWSNTVVTFLNSIASKYPDVKMMQLHTGQEIDLGGARFTVLYTQEDSINAETGEDVFVSVNNYSTVLMVEANGIKTAFLGDFGNYGEGERGYAIERLINPYSDATLKCDVVQAAHHALNRLNAVYTRMKAAYALMSTADTNNIDSLGSNRKKTYTELIDAGVDANRMFFQGRKTWNLSYKNGEITVTYEDITGVDDGYAEHLASCEAYAYTVVYGKTFE